MKLFFWLGVGIVALCAFAANPSQILAAEAACTARPWSPGNYAKIFESGKIEYAYYGGRVVATEQIPAPSGEIWNFTLSSGSRYELRKEGNTWVGAFTSALSPALSVPHIVFNCGE